jgi:hypothetical protein
MSSSSTQSSELPVTDKPEPKSKGLHPALYILYVPKCHPKIRQARIALGFLTDRALRLQQLDSLLQPHHSFQQVVD